MVIQAEVYMHNVSFVRDFLFSKEVNIFPAKIITPKDARHSIFYGTGNMLSFFRNFVGNITVYPVK